MYTSALSLLINIIDIKKINVFNSAVYVGVLKYIVENLPLSKTNKKNTSNQ